MNILKNKTRRNNKIKIFFYVFSFYYYSSILVVYIFDFLLVEKKFSLI